MGQTRPLRRGRVIPVLVAGGIGYLLGGWHVTGLRSTGLSAFQSVAMRFPEAWDDSQPVAAAGLAAPAAIAKADTGRAAPAGSAAATGAMVIADAGDVSNAQDELLSPEPMIPHPASQPVAVPPAMGQRARVEDTASAPMPDAAPHAAQTPASAQNARESRPVLKAREIKPEAAVIYRRNDRPAYMLNDAQIASVKRRLNLTPDQEQMWPAVEAALRNLAYSTAREARERTGPAATAQLASADPNSAEVQDLKSAAIPLIMSFNSQQKDEVRNLAHVMGLDQLASQF